MNISAMDRHLPMDYDYSDEGGVVTLSTTEPENHDLFVAYLAANPLLPLRINIPDRFAYRGEYIIVRLIGYFLIESITRKRKA